MNRDVYMFSPTEPAQVLSDLWVFDAITVGIKMALSGCRLDVNY
jgi:hypothetical protein